MHIPNMRSNQSQDADASMRDSSLLALITSNINLTTTNSTWMNGGEGNFTMTEEEREEEDPDNPLLHPRRN